MAMKFELAGDAAAEDERARVVLESLTPRVDGGRFPIKRVVGEAVRVEVDAFADGHDAVAGVLRYRRLGAPWAEVPLTPLGNDRWTAAFVPDALGRWQYAVEAWIDAFATWHARFAKKATLGQDLELELRVGEGLLRGAASRARGAGAGADGAALDALAGRLVDPARPVEERVALGLATSTAELAERHPDRSHATRTERSYEAVVDPPLARFSAWYELFPRSFGRGKTHGTFRDAERVLPYVAKLGFDVVYLPPIHPIGRAYRKGPNNALVAGPNDPGSPWAIGAAEGGHRAVHPELGSLEDFRRFVAEAARHGLSVALDIAFQASPDHPWVKEHPSWFRHRPDGTIQYAENPPKKYQDIYPLDFESEDWWGLWQELRGVFAFWVEQGVRVFRVDNPHTKSLRFWEWCLDSLKDEHPDLVFLSEAFTRPRLKYGLAKRGFTQGYTYFTWRHDAAEMAAYLEELARSEVAEYFRPNFWPNTPDILPPHLQTGERAAFVQRAVLAATASSNWGIYGPAFELMEHVPRPGVEEYADNEKYEIKDWDLDRDDSLAPLIARLNRIRREHPALHDMRNLTVHGTDNPAFLCYSKRDAATGDTILVVVSFDLAWTQSGFTDLDLDALGLEPDRPFEVHDLIADARYRWSGARNFVELNPVAIPAHVFQVIPS